MRPIALLGPQRLRPTIGDVLPELGADGPIAVVTAGWEEREHEDGELIQLLGASAVNLRLFARHEAVLEAVPALRAAHRDRRAAFEGLRRLYRIRLDHAVKAGWALLRSREDPALLHPEQEAAIETLRGMDAHQMDRVRAIEAAFSPAWGQGVHAALDEQRDAVRGQLDACGAIAIAGGHVGALVHLLEVFGVLADGSADRPIIAWSAGAMVLAERVVLFHDSPPQGPGSVELLGPGLGLVDDLLPFPHARRRLRLDDPVRVGLLARRFAPRTCLTMDEGALLVRENGAWARCEGVSRFEVDGAVTPMDEEAPPT